MSGSTRQLVDSLKLLKTATYGSPTSARHGFAQADEVIELIFELGFEKTPISETDKALIGPLLEDSFKSIKIDVARVATKYRRRLDTDVLQKRSALQFLLDNFGDFPTRTPGVKLSSVLSEANISESIQVLDQLIKTWRNRSDPDDPDTDREEEAADLPASHTWWR